MKDKSPENIININDVINGYDNHLITLSNRVDKDEENDIIYWNDGLVNIAYILKLLVT